MSETHAQGVHDDGKMWSILAVLIIGTFITILNSSLINIALPKMMAVFSVSLDTIQWVVTAYTIALGVVIPLSGYLSDRFGAKNLYLGALAMFTLGSFLCGFAWNSSSMIAFRIIQGLGGGIVGPVGNAIIFRTIPPEKRGIAMGLYGVAAMAAPAIGPTVGGYVVANLSWRVLFYLSIPFGILGVIMGILMLDEIPKNPLGKFDLFGFITSTVGLVCIFYVLGKWTHINWHEMGYPLMLAVGVCSMILFVINELMHPSPLLDLRIFKNYEFTAWLIISSLLGMAMIGISYLIPIFLQSIMGYTAMQTGLLLFPAAVATAFVMPFSGKILDKYGYKAIMFPGLAVFVGVSYAMSFISTDYSSSMINLLLIVRGLSLGAIVMVPTTLCLSGISRSALNQASALQNIVRQLANTVSVTLITVTLQHQITVYAAGLADQLSLFNPNTVDTVKRLQGAYVKAGLSVSDANTAMGTALGGIVQKIAYVNAIDFILSAMFLVSVFVFVFIALIDVPKMFLSKKAAQPNISSGGVSHEPS